MLRRQPRVAIVTSKAPLIVRSGEGLETDRVPEAPRLFIALRPWARG